MLNKVFIEEDKEFSLEEYAHLLQRALGSLLTVDIDKDDVVYSREDVFFTIVDILGYINERTPGRFKIDQVTFQNYIIHYVPSFSIKRKAQNGLIHSKAQSALVIKERTGQLPAWAEQDEAIMEVIDHHEQPKAAPTAGEHVLEARQEVDEHVESLAQEAAKVYQQNGTIPATVTENMKVLQRFHEIINTPPEETDV